MDLAVFVKPKNPSNVLLKNTLGAFLNKKSLNLCLLKKYGMLVACRVFQRSLLSKCSQFDFFECSCILSILSFFEWQSLFYFICQETLPLKVYSHFFTSFILLSFLLYLVFILTFEFFIFLFYVKNFLSLSIFFIFNL